MRNILLPLMLIAALNTCSTMSYGQVVNSKAPAAQIPDPVYIINTNIIANGVVLQLDSKKFGEILVYKNYNAPSLMKNLASAGIISITYNGQINSKSFLDISKDQGIIGSVIFAINGYQLDATQLSTLRIVPEAIGLMKVTAATSKVSATTISIQLTESNSNNYKKGAGTIMIR